MLANPYQNFLHLVLTLFPLYKGENKHQETFSYFSEKHYTCKKTIVYGGSHSITLTWKKKKGLEANTAWGQTKFPHPPAFWIDINLFNIFSLEVSSC